MWRGKPSGLWVNPNVLGFTRALALPEQGPTQMAPEMTKPCMLSDTSQQQHANFVGLALVPRQGYCVQIHYRVQWLKDFGPWAIQ